MNESCDVRHARGNLRKEFLETVSALCGRQATVHFYGLHRPVKAEFVACRPLFEHFAFKDFESPTGHLTRAVVRTPDVIRIEFEIPLHDEDDNKDQ